MSKYFSWPSGPQWNRFFSILTKKEKKFFLIFTFIFSLSFILFLVGTYLENTKIAPAEGGKYTEGVIGSPRLINPVYADANDVDRDLAQLIFSGLMTYDNQGHLIPDMAEDYRILEEGKIYEFRLKDKLFWSDGKPLTADDIIFTVKTIQNPEFKSPIRASWLGVIVEKISAQSVRFRLSGASAIFLENGTLKILPKHIWQDVSAQNFPLINYNLKPVGSGPYRLKNLKQDSDGKIISLILEKNPYSSSRVYIPEISFKFFDSEKDLIASYQKEKINGLAIASALADPAAKASLYSLSLPRYFSVFFNLEKSKIFSQKEVRQALNHGTDKKEIFRLLADSGETVDSPVLPEIYNLATPSVVYAFDANKAESLLFKAGFATTAEGVMEKTIKKEASFKFKSDLRLNSRGTEVVELQKCLARDPEIYPAGEVNGNFGPKTKEAVIKFQEKYAEEILKPSGLKNGNGDVLAGTRKKLNELCAPKSEEKIRLSFSLATVDQPQLIEIANLLKERWKKIGVEVKVESFNISALEKDIIKPRNFDALLFGEVLGAIPDPFPFWHSSQKKDPGLNLTGYENKEADKLLENIRQNLDEKERRKDLEKFQENLIFFAPAVFLYSPDYLYLISKDVKGFETEVITDPSNRFSSISQWYIETKRSWR